MAEALHWTLSTLLDGIVEVPESLAPLVISGLSTDSRSVGEGELFFALPGTTENGAHYIEQALVRGALAVLWERGEVEINNGIQVDGLATKMGWIASRFYGSPSQKLKIAAVTGTDGKSSVAHFLATAMEQLEGGAAVFGTLGNRMVGGAGLETVGSHTTPPAIELQRLFAEVVSRSGNSVAIEASSHGIEQGRLSGTEINTAVLTQVGRDHLDYHGSMAHYRAAKRALFYQQGMEAVVVNLDDDLGREISASPPEGVQLLNYSQSEEDATLLGEVIEQNRMGLLVKIHYSGLSEQFSTPLYGGFNLSNLLAVLGVLLSWNTPFAQACLLLRQVRAVEGRMESFRDTGGCRATLIVDYAHTPGALHAALVAVGEHMQKGEADGQLWLVFGCGGERDRGKRPEMGRIAEQWADRVIITNDNPRGEVPGQIIEEILHGVDDPQAVRVVEDRTEAIRLAYSQAAAEDIILVAGKGHEAVQWIGQEKIPLSDRKIVQSLVAGVGGGHE